MMSVASSNPRQNGNSAVSDSKQAQLKDLQARIAASLAANRLPNLSANKKPANRPAPIILNADGRTVDAEGNEIKLLKRVPTLKANIRVQKKDQLVKPITSGLNKLDDLDNEEASTTFFDPRVEMKAPVRSKKGLVFHEKGKFEAIADTIRKKAQLMALQKGISENSKKHGISIAARLNMLNSIEPKKEEKLEEQPDIEWWDQCVLKQESYQWYMDNRDVLSNEDKFENITHLIEHPMQLRPPTEPTKPVFLKVYYTKKELKKIRRQKRREAQREKQEKIRLGLEPAPEPKVKMSNMMRVLGSQAVQDPTKIEEHVKEQVAKRKREHEETNASRKLTDEQRREKRIRKIKEDTSLGVRVSVYRVLSLSNRARFKVETNAKQLMMTGIAVLYKNINIVVVEGGPKQQKKFRRLMMNRINWSEEAVPKDFAEEGDVKDNKCILVWEGMVKQRAFGDFKIKVSPNESFARELFKNQNVGHYFDLAYSISILDNEDS